jgi:hypothetical protein
MLTCASLALVVLARIRSRASGARETFPQA